MLLSCNEYLVYRNTFMESYWLYNQYRLRLADVAYAKGWSSNRIAGISLRSYFAGAAQLVKTEVREYVV